MPSVPQFLNGFFDSQRHRLSRFDSVAGTIPLRFCVQGYSEPGDCFIHRFHAVCEHVDQGMVAYANPSVDLAASLIGAGEMLSELRSVSFGSVQS
jgi:hypothetical protein